MPYSTPATPTSPSVALPALSAGRPGHRRSYSHISLPDSAMATPTSSSSSSSSSPASSANSSPEIPSSTSTHTSTTSTYGSGAYAPLGSLPRRRSTSSHSALASNLHHSQNTNLNDLMNSPAMTALQANANGGSPTAAAADPPTPTKKPTFQLGHDEEDDDDSSSDEAHKRAAVSFADNAKNGAAYSSASAAHHPHARQSDTDDDGRALPPLRLKQRPTHVHSHHVPFPRTASPRNSPRNSPRSSPRHSPTGSPSTSHATLPTHHTPGPSALSHSAYVRPSLAHHGRSVSSSGSTTSATSPGISSNNNGTATMTMTSPRPVAPPMIRTVSSPVLLLSNGKPLKSSLKGSSSSSSIPFPPQSMVPSRMGVFLAPPPNVDSVNGHQRAASAPTTPMGTPGAEGEQAQVPFPSPGKVQMPMSPLVLVNENAENKNASGGSPMPSFGAALSSLPSLDIGAGGSTSSVSSMTSDAVGTPEYLLSPLNMPGFADTTTNAHVRSQSYDVLHGYHPTGYQGHQHTQSLSFPDHTSQPTTPVAKTVHFPTPDSGGLATVKLYNKGGRPASLLRLGEETETETEGEGSAREGPARWGGWMSGFGGFGAAGKAWGRGGSGSSSGGSGGSVGVHGRQGAQSQAGYPFPKVSAGASPLAPQLTRGESGMERMQEVVSVETVVEVDGANSSPVPARGAQRGEGNVYLESIGFAKGTASTPPSTPADRLLLEGTLLVRNVAYLKTVAVRFTLDDWHTTTDVLARYDSSLPALPSRFVRAAAGELVRGHSLAEQNRGRVCHPDDVDQDLGGSKVVEVTKKEEDQPAWDRFRFDIALGAHGQSLNTLEGRVMWLVGRYSAGVDIADAVVAPASTGSTTTSSVPRSASVERLDEVLAARKPTQEWWDNNAGCNYRIGFVKKDVVVRKQVDTAAEEKKAAEEKRAAEERTKEKEAEAMKREVEKANGAYRRGLHLSAPSVYPATSPPAKSYPAPPQISSSASFPGPSSPPATTYARYQQQQQKQQQKQHQEAVVQSTMARLKKLNLRNYAAPAKYTPPPPTAEKKLSEDTISTASTSTSADSTPLHTPIQVEDEERDQAFGAESKDTNSAGGSYLDVQAPRSDEDSDRTPTFQGAMASPTWGASEAGSELGAGLNMVSPSFMGSMTMMMENGFPASMPTNASSLSPPGLDPGMMGSSPPFSAMSSADVGVSLGNSRAAKSAMAANANSVLYWPWGSSDGDKTTTSNGAAIGKENEPIGSSTALASTPPLSAPVASLLSDIQEKSTSGAPVGSHIAPPQRRRGVHHQQHSQLSSDGSSSSLSSLNGTGSDSQTYTGNRPRPTRTSSTRTSPQIPSASFNPGSGISAPVPVRNGSPTTWGLRSNSPRPGSPRPNGGYSFGSSLSVGASREGGSRSPLRLSPVNSSTAVDAMQSNTTNTNGARTPSPLASTSASAPSAPANSGGIAHGTDFTPPMSPGAGQDDAVYQAFVRQWCFAQAPGPTVGASVGAAGTQTPVGTSPRGEVGPRLVVL